VAILLTASSVLQASEITGSLAFGVVGLTQNGSDLSTSTMFTAVSTRTQDLGHGDFSVVPLSSVFSGFNLDLTTISSGGGFTFSNSSFGDFAASSGSIITQMPMFLNVNLIGTYTPAGMLSGFGPSMADVHLSFTMTGTALSGSYTLTTLPIPEGGTITLLGSGVLAFAAVLRRKLAV
jgi:hypothetical protein